MKTLKQFSIILLLIVLNLQYTSAQEVQDSTNVIHKIVKQNGSALIGKIISQDARELLLQTENVGLVYIPLHEIDEIIQIKENEKIISGGLFSTRYFLTTNGFSIEKGDNYIQWNLFGPDFQFGVADNFTLGIMTSWVGIPIVGTAKYSGKIANKIYGGVGFLGGTGSWVYPEYGLILPFGFISVGDRVNNINITSGYSLLFTDYYDKDYTIIATPRDQYHTNDYRADDIPYSNSEGRLLFSVAAMFRINDKFSFVFDSFFMLKEKKKTIEQVSSGQPDAITKKYTFKIYTYTEPSLPLLPLTVFVPGIRFQSNQSSSFQFGFTGLHFDGEFAPVPIPMIQWFKRI